MSFQRHNKVLVAECRKPNPNQGLIDELANLSFSMRRQTILECVSLQEVLDTFPFLGKEREVCLCIFIHVHLS